MDDARLGRIETALATAQGVLDAIQAEIRMERKERNGDVSHLHRVDHLGADAERREDPAGRPGDEARGRGPLEDQALDNAADDRAGRPVVAGRCDGGSPDDLPAAASDLKIDARYRIIDGIGEGEVGTLRHVDASQFGHLFVTLDMPVGEQIRTRAEKIEPV